MADLQKIIDDLSKLTVTEAAELAIMLKTNWSGVEANGQSLVLFEDRERTQTEPLKRGDTLFDFYDSCARAGYDEFRSVVNGWLAQMPADDRAELISRMRYGGDREFGASLSELSLHACIVGLGFRAKPRPAISGTTKRPDFAAADQAGTPAAYVEVTTANPPVAHEAEKNRENPLYNAIDAAKIPAGLALGYRLLRAGKCSPALRPLVADVERWARENAEDAKAEEVRKTFSAGDWRVELDLYSGGSNPQLSAQAIGAAQMRGGVITPHKDLRDALYEKSRRYGSLDKPYLIAVADGKGQFFSRNRFIQHLPRPCSMMKSCNSTAVRPVSPVRRTDSGMGPSGPRNSHVSGVLLLPETGLWKLRGREVATHPCGQPLG